MVPTIAILDSVDNEKKHRYIILKNGRNNALTESRHLENKCVQTALALSGNTIKTFFK